MKKYLVLIAVLTVVLFAGSAFSEEVFKPNKNNTGQIGTSSRYWRLGYFGTLTGTTVVTEDPDIIYTVASKDWGDASGTWTLSATEAKASIIYNQNSSVAGWVIVAPSAHRIYTVYNNGSATGTFKKSGGTGVPVAARAVLTVAYFAIGSSTDYHVISSAENVPTTDQL